MSTSPLTKVVFVVLATANLLVDGAADVLAVAAGAALVCLAIGLGRRSVRAQRRDAIRQRDNSDRWVAPPPPPRIDRTPTGRRPRDVRCSASLPSRARARGRRATRR